MFPRKSAIHRPLTAAAALAASLTLAAGLTACGGDGKDASGADSTSAGSAGSGTDTATAFVALKDKASGAGYTCVELNDQEDPTTGLTGGLSCLPATDRVGTDPMFVVYGTDTVATGTAAAQKAVDWTASGTSGAADAADGLDISVVKDMYAAVDGDGLAGYCIDSNDNCADILTPFDLTVADLDGSMSVEENVRQQQDDARQRQEQQEEEQRASESAEAQATEEAQKYTGWDDINTAVDQLDSWGISCMEPDNDNGMWGTTCGNADDALFFGGSDEFRDMATEQGATDDQIAQLTRVSDGDWNLICFPDGRDLCTTVADRTGKTVEQGL